MLSLACLLPSAYITDGRAGVLLLAAAASTAPLERLKAQLTSTHELGVGQRAPNEVAATDSPNRTEALIEWATKCTQVVPAGLDMQKDCFNLAMAGSGSRTIYDLAQEAGWTRAAHEHAHTVTMDLASSNPARCFVAELREPAARLESFFKDNADRIKYATMDELFEKKMLEESPRGIPERNLPVHWYFRDFTGVDAGGDRKPYASAKIASMDQLLWGAVSYYKEHPDQVQVPGIDLSKVNADYETNGAPAAVDAPLVNCEEKQIVVAFVCAETLVPSFWDFVNKTKAGEAVTPPAGLQVGVNPVLNVSKYPEPASKFMLSEANRRIWNDAFNFDDMTLYRHFCLGTVDDALVQQNKDAGGAGVAHKKWEPSQ